MQATWKSKLTNWYRRVNDFVRKQITKARAWIPGLWSELTNYFRTARSRLDCFDCYGFDSFPLDSRD